MGQTQVMPPSASPLPLPNLNCGSGSCEAVKTQPESRGIECGRCKTCHYRIDYTWSDIYIESNLSIRAFMVSESAPDYDFTPEDIEITETVTTVWEIEG